MAVSRVKIGFRQAPFIARDEELARLELLLAESRAGHGALALVSGEPGIGKSRLAEEVSVRAKASGFTVLTAHCYEGGGAAPYLAFVETIEEARRTLPAELIERAIGDNEPVISRLVPALAASRRTRSSPTLPVEHERVHVFNAVSDFLLAIASANPTVLLLEDLHWAEDASVLLLKHLGREVADAPLLVLGTFRPGPLPAPGPAQTAALERLLLIPAERIELGPLSEERSAAVAEALAARSLPTALTRAIHQLTEGNPFYIGEVVKHLSDEGRLDGDASAYAGPDQLGIPESIRLVVGRRLERLAPEPRRVLLAAAVLGRTFDHSLLRHVTGLDDETLVDCLDDAERARLIVSEPGPLGARLSFSHELIRQALLSEVSLLRRQQLHARALAAIEAGPDADEHLPELAYHSFRAGPGVDRTRTLGYLSDAAGAALEATDYEAAARLLSEALQLAPKHDAALRCDLLTRLGEAMRRSTDSDEAREMFREAAGLAARLGDTQRLARAALGVARSWPTVGEVDADAVAYLTQAVDSTDEPSLRAQLLSRLSLQLFYAGDGDRVRELSAEAVVAARESGDEIALARTLQIRHVSLWQPQYLDERLTVAREILDVARRTGVREIGLWGHRPLVCDLMELGDIDAAEAESNAYSALAEACRQPIFLWQAMIRRAMLSIHRGRLAEAERLATVALELGRAAGGQNLMAAFGEQMLIIRWLQGRLFELEPLARATLQTQPDLTLWRAVLAFVLRETGRGAEAREEFERAAASEFASLPVDDTRLVALVLLSVVSAALKDSTRSAWLYRELTPYDGRGLALSEGVVGVGAASHYLALLAAARRDFEAAERHFEDALLMNERSGGAPWLAMTQAEYARMLLNRRAPGGRRKARLLLEDALGAARRLGCGGIEAIASSLLGSHAGPGAELPAGLTRREAEVLRLLAIGKSNREISETLVVSERTTARHVTNIYGKIGVRNRTEAAAFAHNRGVV